MKKQSAFVHLAVYGSLLRNGGIGLDSFLKEKGLPGADYVGHGWLPHHGLCVLPEVADVIRTCSIVRRAAGFPGNVARCEVYRIAPRAMQFLTRLEAKNTFSEPFTPIRAYAVARPPRGGKWLRLMVETFISLSCSEFVKRLGSSSERLRELESGRLKYTSIRSGSWLEWKREMLDRA